MNCFIKMVPTMTEFLQKRIKLISKIFLSLVIVFLLIPGAKAAGYAAQCGGDGVSKSIAAGVLSSPVNPAIGTVLASIQSTFPADCYWLSGEGDIVNLNQLQPGGAAVAGYTDIFPTNIAGLGVRYTVDAPECNLSHAVLNSTSRTNFTCVYPGAQTTPIRYTVTITAEFITTAVAVTSGTISSVAPVQYWVKPADGGTTYQQASPVSGTATGSVAAYSCTIAQKDLTKQLDDISVLDLNAVGATAAPMLFQLSLNCPTGNTKVAITMTDSTDATNRSDTLKLAASSTAKGVGIQLLKGDGSPILLGPDSADAGNTNQWVAGTATGGGFLIPLQARYIRTGTLTGGTVKAIATYTMSYQ